MGGFRREGLGAKMQMSGPMAQNLQQFAGGGMPPPGMPPVPQGAGAGVPMPPAGPAMPPKQQGIPIQPPAPKQPPQPAQLAITAAEMAKLGRFGDTIMAHLTPGEIQVPPELQSPKVLAALHKAADKKKVRLEQFMAGNPAQSHNPATGAPEFSFWSALLPAALGVAGGVIGSMVAPGIGTAIGAGIGSAAGTAATGGNLTQIGLAGAGGAAGGYLGGGGLDAVTGATSAAPAATAGLAEMPAMNGGIIGTTSAEAATGAVAPLPGAIGTTMTPGVANNVGHFAAAAAQPSTDLFSRAGLMGVGKAATAIGMGAGIGASLAPPPTQTAPAPFGSNPHMGPVNPNYQSLIGNNGASTTPVFTNYNPIVSVSTPGQGPYNFYPVR